jgi:hypothetical protein
MTTMSTTDADYTLPSKDRSEEKKEEEEEQQQQQKTLEA